jgi:hypothetical protein
VGWIRRRGWRKAVGRAVGLEDPVIFVAMGEEPYMMQPTHDRKPALHPRPCEDFARQFRLSGSACGRPAGGIPNITDKKMTDHPNHVREAQIACALRFQGYEYVRANFEQVEGVIGTGFSTLIQPVVESFTLHQRQEDNFAAFFGLQRHLFKWGGEYLTLYADEHVAFDFLFLHLYRLEPPPQYSNDEYVSRWERDFKGTSEQAAAAIRNSFRRKGRGKRLSI